LSKEALTGSVPLRTFGQLKQLWEARETTGEEGTPPQTGQNQQAAPEPAPPRETSREPASSEQPSAPSVEPNHQAPETP
jgi:uncharacterized protein